MLEQTISLFLAFPVSKRDRMKTQGKLNRIRQSLIQ